MSDHVVDEGKNKLSTIEMLKLIGENRKKMAEVNRLNDKTIRYYDKRNTPEKKQTIVENTAATCMVVGAVALPTILNVANVAPEINDLGMMLMGAFPGMMAGCALSPAVYGIGEGVAKLMNFIREKKCARLESEIQHNNMVLDENLPDEYALQNE